MDSPVKIPEATTKKGKKKKSVQARKNLKVLSISYQKS